jgi:dTDP-4-amino-4,6-dideoxygalactose transaminase
LTDIQASVGIKQLEKLDWIVEERRKIAFKYFEGFKDLPGILLPFENADKTTNFQSFSIYLTDECTLDRNEIMQELLNKGVASRRGIMTTHRETAYNNGTYHLPISEKMADRSIIIPLYVPMTNEEIEKVITEIKLILLNH